MIYYQNNKTPSLISVCVCGSKSTQNVTKDDKDYGCVVWRITL